jgi:hypothetical protein
VSVSNAKANGLEFSATKRYIVYVGHSIKKRASSFQTYVHSILLLAEIIIIIDHPFGTHASSRLTALSIASS